MASETFEQLYLDILSDHYNDGLNGRILDIGSKDGEIVSGLAEWFGCDGVGIDLQFELTNETKWAEFIRADTIRLPFSPDSFDAVICNMVFEHIPNEAAAINEVARVLKPNGIFVVIFPNRVFPIDGHAYPNGIQWLPKQIAIPIVDLITEPERAEYFRSGMFYVSPLGVKRHLRREFETVTYESSRLLDTQATSDTWKSQALRMLEKPLRVAFHAPGVRTVTEYSFPVSVYSATDASPLHLPAE